MDPNADASIDGNGLSGSDGSAGSNESMGSNGLTGSNSPFPVNEELPQVVLLSSSGNDNDSPDQVRKRKMEDYSEDEDEDEDDNKEEEDDSIYGDDPVLREYFREFRISKGFDITRVPEKGMYSYIRPCEFERDPSDKVFMLIKKCTLYAIEQHNKEKGENLQLVEIVKANARLCAGYVFYITFIAEDPDSRNQNIYQAEVYSGIKDEPVELVIFRRKPQPLTVN